MATWSGRPAASAARPAARRSVSSARRVVGGVVQLAQGREAGGDRERVARERPGLVDVAGRGDPLHQLARPGEGGGGQAAADHLAEDGQVGLDP